MNSLFWKRLLSIYYPAFFFKKKPRKIILIYHAVGIGPWAIATPVFEKQIQFLKKHCRMVSLINLLQNAAPENEIEVSLTFDDGYACLYNHVFPILQVENIPATVYVNTGWIGSIEDERKHSRPDLGHYLGEKFLIWPEVKTLEKNGWEIGSHGVNHIDLTQQNQTTINNELTHSKLTIENILQKKCLHFAYTFGKHSSTLRKAVSHAGYQYAVAGHHQALTQCVDLIALPRLNIEIGYSMHDFENIITGKWDFIGIIHKIKRIFSK